MSKIDDVKDFLIGLVFYIGLCVFTIWALETILALLFGEMNG